MTVALLATQGRSTHHSLFFFSFPKLATHMLARNGLQLENPVSKGTTALTRSHLADVCGPGKKVELFVLASPRPKSYARVNGKDVSPATEPPFYLFLPHQGSQTQLQQTRRRKRRRRRRADAGTWISIRHSTFVSGRRSLFSSSATLALSYSLHHQLNALKMY